jgi:superfamily II DNA or RNA helicase
MSNLEKGTKYEEFICDYINNNVPNTIAYLWKNVPDIILYECRFFETHNYDEYRKNRENDENPLIDIGIDIIQHNIETNKYIYVQCKNYENSLCIHDLAGYFAVMSQPEHSDKEGHIYVSNNKISHNLLKICNKKKHTFIHIPFMNKNDIIDQKVLIPYNYQIECLNKFNDYYKENNNGILTMPCGTGKTFTSYLISKNYKIVVIMSPLKQFAEQNIACFKTYNVIDECKYMLIDSDGIRDINVIKNEIIKSKKIVLSSTYKSSDIISLIIDEYKNDLFIIIDEFHDLSYGNIYNKNDYMNKIINSNSKKLYMSATPRIYELENNNDCDIEKILGKIVFSMGFREAIQKGYISDYNIFVPINDNMNFESLIEQIGIKNNDQLLCKKVCYYFECIKNIGNLKSIFYFQSHDHIDRFIECFNDVNNYYNYKYSIEKITCSDTQLQRNSKINKFKKNIGISILCSVCILDECVDIPSCDSVYITYNCQSKVKIIQRISRSLRKNNNKIAKILVWCEKINELANFISSIKESDIELEKRIKYIKCENKFKSFNEIKNEQLEYVKKFNNEICDIKFYKKPLNDIIFCDDNINIKKPLFHQNNDLYKYGCDMCKRSFKKKQHLENHQNKKMPCLQNNGECDIINEKKEEIIVLDKNTNIIDAKKMEEYLAQCKCVYCEKQFTRRDNVMCHIKNRCKRVKETENEKQQIFDRLKKIEEENQKLKEKLNIKNEEIIKKEDETQKMIVKFMKELKKNKKEKNTSNKNPHNTDNSINNSLNTDNSVHNTQLNTQLNALQHIYLVNYNEQNMPELSK